MNDTFHFAVYAIVKTNQIKINTQIKQLTMGKLLKNTLFIYVFFITMQGYSTTFRSKLSGDWSAYTTWQYMKTNGTWSDVQNNQQAPTNSDDIIIRVGHIITISANANCVNLLDSGAIVINSGITLNVQNLTISSNITGGIINSGSVINNGTVIVSGTTTVQRYIPSDDWHVISSPVSNQVLYAFGNSNAVDHDGNTFDLGPYVESTNSWSYPVSISSGTATFDVGKGYVLRRKLSTSGGGPGVVTFTGALNSGTINTSISKTASLYGWNCLGNPYPSAIRLVDANNDFTGTDNFLDVNDGVLDPNFAAIYVWDHTMLRYRAINNTNWNAGTYTANNIGTALSQTSVALGQGFMVKSANASASVSFTPAMQVHSDESGAIPFKSAGDLWPSLWLSVKSGENSTGTLVAFNEKMTNGLDRTFDAGLYRSNNGLEVYTKLLDDNDVDFAVQALPDVSLDSLRIPVGLDLTTGGEVVFSLKTSQFPFDSKVFLEDKITGAKTLLNAEDAKYTVSVPENTKGSDRFILLITQYAKTGLKDLEKSSYKVHAFDKTIYIQGPATEQTVFELYSIDGKRWYSGKAENLSTNQINGSSFPVGVYVLKINDRGSVQSSKIVLAEK